MPTIAQLKQRQLQEAVDVQQIYRRSNEDELEPSAYRQYRKLAGYGSPIPTVNLPSRLQDQMQNVCLWLYQSNPVAHRYVEMMKEYIVGDGIVIEARDEKVRKALNSFWNHPSNNMDEKISLVVGELSIYGEVALGLFVEEPSNILRTSYLSPSWIDKVSADPADLSHFTTLSIKKNALKDGSNSTYTLLGMGSDGRKIGDAIYLPVNRVSDGTRGISDLLPLVDVVGDLDTYLFNTVEKAGHMTDFFWDATYEGANDDELTRYSRRVQEEGFHPGAIRMHNEKVKWAPQTVQLRGDETEKLFNSIFSVVVTGLGWPSHWTGLGAVGGSRAGEASTDPAYRMFITRQGVIRRFIKDLLDYQLDLHQRSGILPLDVDRTYKIVMPTVAIRDLQRMGGALSRVTDALLACVEQGIYTKEEAKDKIESLLQQLM